MKGIDKIRLTVIVTIVACFLSCALSACNGHTHSYTSSVISPTCTEQGYTLYECACGEQYKDEYAEALGHDEQPHEAKAPTCGVIGWNVYVDCSRCDYTTYSEIKATGDHVFTVYTYDNNATCIADGTETAKCEECGVATTRTSEAHLKTGAHTYDDHVCSVCFDIDPKAPSTQGLEYTAIEENDEVIAYSVVKGTAQIGRYIKIPDTYQNKPVTKIGYDAFASCKDLLYVSIPSSVTNISKNAFYGCDNLRYNEYDNGLYLGNTDNPYFALMKVNNSNVTDFSINDNTKLLHENAFNYCNALRSLVMPGSVSHIGFGEFLSCDNLRSVYYSGDIADWCGIKFENTFSNPLTRAHYLYIDNELVTNVIIPNTVKEIKDFAFELSSITSVIIPNSVTRIGRYAFGFCSITSIVIPSSVTTIGDNAFYSCTRLTSIEIPDSVTSIGEHAFYDCMSLTSVEIHGGVTCIGSEMFRKCSSLTDVKISGGVTSIGQRAFEQCGKLTNIELPDSLTSIEEYAFFKCESLKSVNIPDSVTSIGYCAFSGCTGLISATIGNSVASIDNGAFMNCTQLTSMVLPNSVTDIGSGVFYGCSGISSIIIPSSVTSIGSRAFAFCSNLTSISVQSGNTRYNIKGNCLIDVETKTLIKGCKNSVIPSDGSVISIDEFAFAGCAGLTNIDIPDSITRIGISAFNGCADLTEVVIPNSVTSIEQYTFAHCSGLTSVVIPDSVTSIGYCAFEGCDSLQFNAYDNGLYLGNTDNPYLVLVKAKNNSITSCIVNNNTKIIYDRAFSSCSDLIHVIIPASVEDIGSQALSANRLKSVKYGGTTEQWKAITKASTWYSSSLDAVECTDGVINLPHGAWGAAGV